MTELRFTNSESLAITTVFVVAVSQFYRSCSVKSERSGAGVTVPVHLQNALYPGAAV